MAFAIDAKAIRYDHRRGRRRLRSSRGQADSDPAAIDNASGGIGPLDFTAEPGRVVGLAGPNGAGKSTLLRLFATLLEPDAGELRLFGMPAEGGRRGARRRIGWVPDSAPHFRRLTGRENVVLFGRAAGMSAAAAQTAASRLLERLGLAADADRAAREYSFGMARKLAIAEALVHSPPLALLDEPTIGLDPDSRRETLALLRERADAGAAVVLATNDVDAAHALCDSVGLLHRGRLVAVGEPSELVATAGGAERIEVSWEAGADSPRLPPGVEPAGARPGWVRVRAETGAHALPELCRALLEQGCVIRSIDVRRPDLRDAFESLTGSAWANGADAGEQETALDGLQASRAQARDRRASEAG